MVLVRYKGVGVRVSLAGREYDFTSGSCEVEEADAARITSNADFTVEQKAPNGAGGS